MGWGVGERDLVVTAVGGTSVICYAKVYVQVTHRYFENFCNISLF